METKTKTKVIEVLVNFKLARKIEKIKQNLKKKNENADVTITYFYNDRARKFWWSIVLLHPGWCHLFAFADASLEKVISTAEKEIKECIR